MEVNVSVCLGYWGLWRGEGFRRGFSGDQRLVCRACAMSADAGDGLYVCLQVLCGRTNAIAGKRAPTDGGESVGAVLARDER